MKGKKKQQEKVEAAAFMKALQLQDFVETLREEVVPMLSQYYIQTRDQFLADGVGPAEAHDIAKALILQAMSGGGDK